MQSPRIFVDARAVFRDLGGVGRAVFSTVRELDRTGGVRLIVLNNHLEHWRGMNHVEVLSYPTGRAQTLETRTWWEQTALPKLVRSTGADAFWAPWNWGVPWIAGVPSLLTIHDLIPNRQANPMGSRFRSWLYRANLAQSIRCADSIVCISEFTRLEMVQTFPASAKKSRVIHWGVDSAFAPGPEHRLGNEIKLLYVGGKELRKNLAVLLRACSSASDSLQPLRLRLSLTGKESQLDALTARACIEARSRMKVDFLGYVEEADLVRHYRDSHVFVFPSLEEGFGFPPLEAQASGLPVICGTCDSIPEILGNGAAFADVRSAEDLANVICRVVTSAPERSELRHRGLINARRFDWGRCAAEYLQLLVGLVYNKQRKI
jgi:glycosyltransferase involved in cell wall biosynthesis